ncbi:MAG: hypothetical protein N2319_00605 [Candidatus Kapabacteria bacterium]|nr:hypothetical protein [Candidatus Kapabacteria bacterium]
MDLLLIINGRIEKLVSVHNLNINNLEVVKIDEKDLAKPKKILKILKSKKFNNVYFACIENDLQRFHFFMFLYSLLSFRWKASIIDELGNKKIFSIIKFFLLNLPMFVIETILSFFVIVYYKIKIPILKWKLKIH